MYKYGLRIVDKGSKNKKKEIFGKYSKLLAFSENYVIILNRDLVKAPGYGFSVANTGSEQK